MKKKSKREGISKDISIVPSTVVQLYDSRKSFDLGDLRRGSGNFFKIYSFEIRALPTKKMRYVTAF